MERDENIKINISIKIYNYCIEDIWLNVIINRVKGGFWMKNKIKDILKENRISIISLSQAIDMNYANTHNLVNREDLGDTKLKTLKAVADYLSMEVTDLWED